MFIFIIIIKNNIYSIKIFINFENKLYQVLLHIILYYDYYYTLSLLILLVLLY